MAEVLPVYHVTFAIVTLSQKITCDVIAKDEHEAEQLAWDLLREEYPNLDNEVIYVIDMNSDELSQNRSRGKTGRG